MITMHACSLIVFSEHLLSILSVSIRYFLAKNLAVDYIDIVDIIDIIIIGISRNLFIRLLELYILLIYIIIIYI